MDDEPLRRAETHFGSIASARSSPHLQAVVRATDSAITQVHGLPPTAPPTPAWEELTTNNYKNTYDTRSVFERYAIVSQSDLADALKKLEAN
jgi:hypothetical protein